MAPREEVLPRRPEYNGRDRARLLAARNVTVQWHRTQFGGTARILVEGGGTAFCRLLDLRRLGRSAGMDDPPFR